MKSTHFINTLLFALGLGLSIQAAQAGCGGPGVFNVWGSDGKIAIGNSYTTETSTCKPTISGSSYFNVSADNFIEPQWIDVNDGNKFKDACSVIQKKVSPTGITLDRFTLPAFPTDTRAVDIKYTHPDAYISVGNDTAGDQGQGCLDNASADCRPYKFITNGSKWKLWPNVNINDPQFTSDDGATFPPREGDPLVISNRMEHVYDEVYSQSSKLYFKYDGTQPYIINTLTVGNDGVEVTFEPGDYYFNSFSFTTTIVLKVADKDSHGNPLGNGSGKVNIYVKNASGSTFVGSGSCLNIDGVTTFQQCQEVRDRINAGIDLNAQHPEKLAFWFYNGTLTLNDTVFVAASIYNDDPAGEVFFRANNNTTFVGEILAKNIRTLNQGPVYMHYKDTGVFTDLYAQAVIPRTGEYSLAAPAVPDIAVTGDYAFIASQTEVDDNMHPAFGGHLKAYAFRDDATTSSTAAWDANTHMIALQQAGRALRLYSNTSSGTKTLISALGASDYAAFGYPSMLQLPLATLAATKSIAGPSMATFLKGDWNTIIGLPNGAQPLIYKDMVLFSTSDGYLYAVNRSTGAMEWGWMPRPLLSGLQDYETFLHSDPMQGQLSATVTTGRLEDETSDDTTNPKTGYVLGTAKGGAIHYGLNINSDGTLGDLAWIDARQADDSRATTYAELTATSPNAAAPVIFAESTGDNKALYIVNNKLVIRPYAGGSANVNTQPDLGGNVITSTPLVARKKRNVIENTLYVGDNKGYVWTASLSSPENPGSFSKISSDTLGGSEPVRYLSIAQMGDYEYLVAQSDVRITAFKRLTTSATSTWSKAWTSTVGSATEWKPDGTTETNTTAGTNTSKVQPLPTGAALKSKASILGGIVFAPVTIEDPQACTTAAYEYLFNLENGHFPPGSLYGAYYKNSKMLDNLYIGIGQAFAPQSMIFEGKLTVQGHSEQNATDANGNAAGGLDNPIELRAAKDLVGRRGWKELIED